MTESGRLNFTGLFFFSKMLDYKEKSPVFRRGKAGFAPVGDIWIMPYQY
jgi:hypothetical protein